jgi:ribosomal protein S27E
LDAWSLKAMFEDILKNKINEGIKCSNCNEDIVFDKPEYGMIEIICLKCGQMMLYVAGGFYRGDKSDSI